MDKKKIQEAVARIDNALAQLNASRQVHIALVHDVQLIQQCCMKQFDLVEAQKDVGTNIIPIHPQPCNENIEGSGDGI